MIDTDHMITFRCAKNLRSALLEAAEGAGMTVSQFLRLAALREISRTKGAPSDRVSA